jgi:hypothetical protein
MITEASPIGASPYGDKLKPFPGGPNLGYDITHSETGTSMRVLKEHPGMDFEPARFARRFRQLVGLRLSHVCLVAILLAAMYVATESYSGEAGYSGAPAAESVIRG